MDRIEILAVDLLDQHRPLVEELKTIARQLQLEFGWHYLLDLAWILSHLGEVSGKVILDAGAGMGVLQWFLAAHGATVLSVDRSSRADLPWRFRRWTRVKGLRPMDLNPPLSALVNAWRKNKSLRTRFGSMKQVVSGFWKSTPRNLKPLSLRERGRGEGGNPWMANGSGQGSVWIYNQDLSDLTDIPENCLDAVAALSALEHNPPDRLPQVVQELMRVLKPGGILLATLGASADRDWFHEPSQGWCYSETTLRRAFDLTPETPSNYARYAELMEKLRACAELRNNLASFYFRSGENGMPWGKWDPQYQSVGVLKVKRTSESRDR
jgi:SAM-dependent methyltransferase